MHESCTARAKSTAYIQGIHTRGPLCRRGASKHLPKSSPKKPKAIVPAFFYTGNALAMAIGSSLCQAALGSGIRHRLAELATHPGPGLGQLLAVDIPHLLFTAAGGALGPEARNRCPPVGCDCFPGVLLLCHHSLDNEFAI